jgi:hypothetical protein
LDLSYLDYRLLHEKAEIDAYCERAQVARSLLISLIVPTYGIALRYLQHFIDSVREQTYTNWELCICDDGDPLPEVRAYLDQLAARGGGRFRLIRHLQNRGICAATRSALSLARGEVLVFADADDLLHPRALVALAQEFAADEEIDFVYTDHDRLTDWGFRLRPIRKPGYSPELLYSANYINHLVGIRKSCLLACGDLFSDEVNGCQDWELCLQISRMARRVVHIPLVLYHWRARPGSVAVSPAAKPWMMPKAVAMMQRHVAGISHRLCTVRPPGSTSRLSLRADVEGPPLYVFDIGQAGPVLGYRGKVRHQVLAAPDASALARAIDAAVRAIVEPASLVLFRVAGEPELNGPIEELCAYALLRGVGAVWPFCDPWRRSAYTIHRRRLRQLTTARGTFSSYTGNVLTGALHGLLTRAELIAELGFAEMTEVIPSEDIRALGASFGLSCLRAGYRNVCVQGVLCACKLPELPLPDSFPAFDPYA